MRVVSDSLRRPKAPPPLTRGGASLYGGLDLIDTYLDALWLERGVSEHTLAAYRRDLEAWARRVAAADGDLLMPPPALLPDWLAERRAGAYQLRSNARLLSTLRGFYRWALTEGHIEQDPLAEVRLPPVRPSLPNTLDEGEVERLLAAPDVDTALGLRDRAMLEVLYGCGLRVSELVNLSLDAIKDRKSTRLNSSHVRISYAVFCLKKKKHNHNN